MTAGNLRMRGHRQGLQVWTSASAKQRPHLVNVRKPVLRCTLNRACQQRRLQARAQCRMWFSVRVLRPVQTEQWFTKDACMPWRRSWSSKSCVQLNRDHRETYEATFVLFPAVPSRPIRHFNTCLIAATHPIKTA